MNFGEANPDLANEIAERERQAGIARVRLALNGPSGRLICDCGEPIGEKRRRAMPNARDCIQCATFRAGRPQRRRA